MNSDKVKKQSIKEIRKLDIMSMDLTKPITLQDVMDTLNVKDQTARLLLTDLEHEMKLIKYGRGNSAVWKAYNEE